MTNFPVCGFTTKWRKIHTHTESIHGIQCGGLKPQVRLHVCVFFLVLVITLVMSDIAMKFQRIYPYLRACLTKEVNGDTVCYHLGQKNKKWLPRMSKYETARVAGEK